MEILVHRNASTAECTISNVYVDGKWECFVLEDIVRQGQKVFGKTAIPAGRYQVIISWSPRFKRQLPLLLNVPNYLGIRIHAGNRAVDTEGCLLPGTRIGADGNSVELSRAAFDKLFAKIQKAGKQESVWLTIK